MGCTGDESVWASGRVGQDAPTGGRARATGGSRVRVGGAGRDCGVGKGVGGDGNLTNAKILEFQLNFILR